MSLAVFSQVLTEVSVVVVVAQLLSCVQLFAIPRTTVYQTSLSLTFSWNLLKLTSIESVMLSNYLFFCCCLLLLASIVPSIRVFFSASALCIRWPKYCSFSFNISPSSEYSGLISFRIDRFDLLAVQGTLKSLQQFKTVSNTTVQKHQFFSAQLSLYFNFHICT